MNRKQRRAQESKVRTGATLETANRSAPMFTKIYLAEAKSASEILGTAKLDRAKLEELIENALEFAAAFNDEKMIVACGAGCYYCCYQKVGTTAPEIVRIASWMRDHMSEDDRAAIVRALDEVVAQRSPTGSEAVRCPFLSGEGTCRIYEVRPLACRSVTSASSEPCRAWQEEGAPLGNVADKRRYTSHSATLQGLDRGISTRGIQGGYLDFHSALRFALVEESAVDRWYAGEHVFGPMTIPPRHKRLLPML
jgi:Fe-S-cluster containining protein